MRFSVLLYVIFGVFTPFLNAQAYVSYDRLDRQSFNQLAQEINMPIFWRNDIDKNNTIDPNEIVYLWGMRPEKKLTNYVNQGKFTQEFAKAYELMVKQHQQTQPDPDTIKDPEQKRRALVIKELEQARPTLIESDFRYRSSEDKAVVQHIQNLAALMDEIFLRQNGVYNWQSNVPTDDLASQTLFYRNHGPFCLNPKTENNLDCSALPNKPKRVVEVYPASLQEDKNFCEVLQKSPDAVRLSKPFAIVASEDGQLITRPYSQVYPEMSKVADELRATAAVIKDSKEAAFKTYLLAAAQAFTDNNWYSADESWSKMNATNSKWYLRIGPDEQYWEPCSLKAGFHLSFAEINRDSLIWQDKLNPFKDEMEHLLATMAGPPYHARTVSFHLPDFIDIVLNAGDSRSHAGGTIGQSLPNSGPVANEGRGRTVVMANLAFPDADSRKQYFDRASSLLCSSTMINVVADPKLSNMSTVLHEAAHNLGPAHEYKVAGKVDREIFGGQMASMLEELKAQTSALYFTDWLVQKRMIDAKTAEHEKLDELLWAFGHIARGMYTAEGSYKTYSQLAAIQFGALIKSGAVVWSDQEKAANGVDRGCFMVNLPKFSSTIASLEKEVLQIKGSGDKQRAEALRKEMVDDNATLKKLHSIIAERVLRAKSSTFVYAIHN